MVFIFYLILVCVFNNELFTCLNKLSINIYIYIYIYIYIVLQIHTDLVDLSIFP